MAGTGIQAKEKGFPKEEGMNGAAATGNASCREGPATERAA